MKLHVIALRDIKADLFLAPMFVPNINVALRDISDTMKDANTIWAKHPGDFELYKLGVWDAQTAEFESNKSQLMVLTDLIPRAN